MDLEELGNGVYACMQEDKGLGCSNSGLLVNGGGLVVDTFWDLPHTRDMINLYKRVWKAPVDRVVNTHRNGDHCWGNQLFTGAEIIGHRLCAEEFDKESPEMMAALSQGVEDSNPAVAGLALQLQAFDFSDIKLTPPTTLFEDRLTLDMEGTAVELIYVGPAHTQGDIIVHVPEQRVVFAGDVLFRLCTPIGWEGTYQHWFDALELIIDLQPEIVVPGHGPICGIEGPREMSEYLRFVQTESRRLFEAGLDELAAAKKIDLGPYAGWTEPERLCFNVHRAYREFRGEAFDTPTDTTVLFSQMRELAQSWHHH